MAVIVILLAIIAGSAALGAGVWVHSWLQNQRLLNQVQSAAEDLWKTPDLRGTWTGTYSGGKTGQSVTLTITNSEPIHGNIRVSHDPAEFAMSQTASAHGANPSGSSALSMVDFTPTSGDCRRNEWKLSVSGNTITTTQNWSESGGGASSSLILHRSLD